MPIDTLAALRARYPAPKERALRKQLDRLDRHGRAFIALSPFVVLASHGADGELDASPRGGEPGFVQVLDERTLLLPDSPGNNRLDTLSNIVATGRLGLLFMVPLSGWLMSSAKGFQTVYFGVLPIPDLLGKNKELASLLEDAHEVLTCTLLGLVAMHVAAALKHHFINRDGVLQRMLPFGSHR